MTADGHAPTCPLVCCTSADDPAVTGVPLPKERWLGHRDLCALQWGEDCDCPDGPEYLAEYLAEQRPDDDPAPIPTCDGRDCGGRPHE